LLIVQHPGEVSEPVLQKLHFRFPAVLFALTIISFGLLIPWLGFYWDDWPKTLVHRVWGMQGYWSYYAEDRPLSGWTHIFWITLIGDTPLHWHLLNLILRWLSACGMWWTFTGLWPYARRQVSLATLLFVVYPVFDQQSIPVTYHQQWMQYALIFLSFWAMVYAVRDGKHFVLLTCTALVSSIVQLTITEYFIGMELLRPFLLWILVSRRTDGQMNRVLETLKHWSPYLFVTAAFIIYRLFFIQLSGEDPYRANTLYNLVSRPASTLLDLLKIVGVDTLFVLVANWAKQLALGLNETDLRITLTSWAAGLAAAGLIIGLTNQMPEPQNDSSKRKSWIIEALIIGLAGTLLGCVPAWVTGRQVLFDAHSNRYAQEAMFGASLVWAAGIEWLIVEWRRKILFIGALIFLAVGFHFRTSVEYTDSWSSQKRFYWQLSWRAPFIKPLTAIISDDTIIAGLDTFSFSSAINALYPQPPGAQNLSYWIYTLKPKYATYVPQPLEIKFKTQFRTLTFVGKTPDSLLVYFTPHKTNCVWIIDPTDKYNPDLPDLYKKFLPISNPGRIEENITPSNYPPQDILGPEPVHDWCYYFEKADLARQMGDWQQVASLGDKAQDLGYKVSRTGPSLIEWRPFIEGYARIGRWDEARDLIFKVMAIDTQYDIPFCQLWRRVLANTQESSKRLEVHSAIWQECACQGRGE
jgi:hypothetical protein